MRFVLLAVFVASPAIADRFEPQQPQPPQATRPAPANGPSMARQQRLPPPPPPPVRVYVPPPEVARLASALDGSWACKGVVFAGDGSSQPLVGTLASKLELGGAWLQSTFVENGAPRFVAFRTYDTVAKQWTRVYVDRAAGRVDETSLGEKNGMWTWTGTATTTAGTFDARDFEQRDGAQIKLWGELMLAGQWQKLYEVTCKK